MAFEELVVGTKWMILRELARGNKSAAEIAKRTGQSIANVGQQLKLLEAYNAIKRVDSPKVNAPGKPKTYYELNQEFIVINVLRKGLAERKAAKFKEISNFHIFSFNTTFICPPEDHYPVMAYICQSEMLRRAESIGYLKSNEKEVELFIISDKFHEIRQDFSNLTVKNEDGKTKKVISWTHSKKEVEEGIARNEEYFLNLVRTSKELIDKKGDLAELKGRI